MRVKDKFELISKEGTPVLNVVDLPETTLKTFSIDEESRMYLVGLVKTFFRIKGHSLGGLTSDLIPECLVVKLPQYPLAGFVTSTFKPVVNLSPITLTDITDYSPLVAFSLFLYAISLSLFIKNKPFKRGIDLDVSKMYFSVFMKLYGKKAGLVGSYINLIPKLQFLINLYTVTGLMGLPQDKDLIRQISTRYYVNPTEMNLDYDFKSIVQLLRAINDNNILSISEYKFSESITKMFGISSIPMFEDISRFFSSILVASIPGNSYISNYWSKVNTKLFQKLLFIGISEARRSHEGSRPLLLGRH